MRKTIVITALFTLAGCGGQLEADGNGDVEITNIPKPGPGPLPPMPLVAWQMAGCLDADHRQGLILALQQLSHNSPRLARIAQTVGQSSCNGVQETGGLFDPAVTAALRTQRLAMMSFRSVSHAYAFLISATEIQDVATRDIAYWGVDQRFNDQGSVLATGRYEVEGYASGITLNSGLFDQRYHVVDHTNGKHVDLMLQSGFILQNGVVTGDFHSGAVADPPSTSDPLLQTIVNATNSYLVAFNYAPPVDWSDPIGDVVQAIDLAKAPSLSGWPMPFSSVAGDATGDIVAQGGSY